MWHWDVGGFENAPASISIRRWRRGPLTFYRYTIHLPTGTSISYWMYFANDFGFAVHIPAWLHDFMTGEK